MSRLPRLRALLCVGVMCHLLGAQQLPSKDAQKTTDLPDLSEFRTVDNAITTRITKVGPQTVPQPAYLGVHVALNNGKLAVASVEEGSPAALAGLKPGDLLTRIAGQTIDNPDGLRSFLQGQTPGTALKLEVVRETKALELTATLGSTSRPLKLGSGRPVLGLQLSEGVVATVFPGSAAGMAGVKSGDLIVKVDGKNFESDGLNDILALKKAGDTVKLTVKRDGKDLDVSVRVPPDAGFKKGGWDTRTMFLWKKKTYRLAVVCIEYPDIKHNPKITTDNWAEALFSSKTYNASSATGQPVFGSLHDYYQEQSFGNLNVVGKVFDFVQVSKKRADYAQLTGFNRTALLSEGLDKLQERDGKDVLKDFDGIFFLYAGERAKTARTGLYWPHRAFVFHKGKRWSYFISSEGGPRMSTISVICHEFGHMLGLPDLYARPENPGSEGAGVWCAMSNQFGNGRPQHFCAWAKEQLAWVEPAVIDPTVKQKIVLRPIEDSSKECVKVLIKRDGSEYLLLENRKRKGFDLELPGEGLLIWRVAHNKPVLEESHGVEGPFGPRVFLSMVPYPTKANNSYTPYTTPSSRSHLVGGLPVHITNIRRLPDGRITFFIGYEYY